jgi:TonB family protein
MRTVTLIALAIALKSGIAYAGSAYAQPRAPQSNSASISTTTPNTADDESFSRFERVTPGVTPPKATHSPDPKYPDLPVDADDRGLVVMLVGVNANGRVGAVHVLRSTNTVFEATAVSTVKKWKFKPAQKNGQPIPVQVTVEMKFER